MPNALANPRLKRQSGNEEGNQNAQAHQKESHKENDGQNNEKMSPNRKSIMEKTTNKHKQRGRTRQKSAKLYRFEESRSRHESCSQERKNPKSKISERPTDLEAPLNIHKTTLSTEKTKLSKVAERYARHCEVTSKIDWSVSHRSGSKARAVSVGRLPSFESTPHSARVRQESEKYKNTLKPSIGLPSKEHVDVLKKKLVRDTTKDWTVENQVAERDLHLVKLRWFS